MRKTSPQEIKQVLGGTGPALIPPAHGETWYELHAACTAQRGRILIDRIEGDTVHIVRVYTGRKTKAKLSRFNGKVGGYAREWRKV